MKPIKSLILCLISLTAGGISGFFISKHIYKKKYEKYADEEIASVKEVYAKHHMARYSGEKPEEGTPDNESEHMLSRSSLNMPDMQHEGEKKAYVDYSAPYRKPESLPGPLGDPAVARIEPCPSIVGHEHIYILTPEEFESSDNDAQTLFYYRDGILTDDDYNIIKNPEELIGPDALNRFGAYHVDAVYVRNEKTKKDYEILLDNHAYLDVAPRGAGSPQE